MKTMQEKYIIPNHTEDILRKELKEYLDNCTSNQQYFFFSKIYPSIEAIPGDQLLYMIKLAKETIQLNKSVYLE